MNKHLFNQEDIASPNNRAAKIKVQNVKANTDRTFPRDVFFLLVCQRLIEDT